MDRQVRAPEFAGQEVRWAAAGHSSAESPAAPTAFCFSFAVARNFVVAPSVFLFDLHEIRVQALAYGHRDNDLLKSRLSTQSNAPDYRR